jgi:hypothetical protein
VVVEGQGRGLRVKKRKIIDGERGQCTGKFGIELQGLAISGERVYIGEDTVYIIPSDPTNISKL